jgi:hypothetical protein
MPFDEYCSLCEVIIKNKRSYNLKESESLFHNINELYVLLHSRPLEDHCKICNTCYQKHSRRLKLSNKPSVSSKRSASIESMDVDLQINNTTQTDQNLLYNKGVNCSILIPDTVRLPVYIPSFSREYCSICKRKLYGTSFMEITDNIRFYTLLNHMVYFKSGTRCCTAHVVEEQLSSKAIQLIKNHYEINDSVSTSILTSILDDIWSDWKRCRIALEMKPIPIDYNESLRYTDHDYWTLIGINKNDFNDLCNQIGMRNTINRSIHTAVGCLLTKLRLGLSNNVLATLFSFSDKRIVGHILESARQSLVKDFVSNHLGFEHISRETIIRDHTRPLAKYLLTGGKDSVVLILDGTYIYCQKSACNLLQRRLFSMHKSRPLIKPMMCVATDGYICSAIGPYFADWHNNDANILDHILRTNEEEILNWLRPGDTFVVDRGFRDVLDQIRSHGFNVYMPSFLPKSTKKYTTSEANQNRFVTKIRWIVESVNGRIKQFKFFDRVIQNSCLPYVHDYLRIVCAITNAYHSRLILNTTNDAEIARVMLEREKKKNLLEKKLDDKDFQKAKKWERMEVNKAVPDFPILSQSQLQDLLLGIFQLKQAKSYANEHINDDGVYEILVSTETSGLLRAKIQSRHSNRKKYNAIIQYNNRTVLEWCCQCPYGNVTIGTCSHVASILWYLSLARYDKSKMNQLSSNYLDIFRDASSTDLTDESNDEEESDGDSAEEDDDDNTLYSLA